MNVIRRYATLASSVVFAAAICVSAQAAPSGAVLGPTVRRSATISRQMPHTQFNMRHFGAAVAGDPASQAICSRLITPSNPRPAHALAASSGAQMYCFGPGNGTNRPQRHQRTFLSQALAVGGNVDAANPSEDISPSGTYAYGQSETSIGAIDNNVVEAWNDSTGFFSPNCSPSYKDQLTGYGLSTDGGRHFADLGGLPNAACATSGFSGDAFVEAYKDPATGRDIFYIGSLYGTAGTGPGTPHGLLVALDACKVSGSYLSCNGPFVISVPNPGNKNSDFLDKDFGTIDPAHKRLYITYTDFSDVGGGNFSDNIDLSACDIRNPMSPVCGSRPVFTANVAGSCEDEGAYPAVDRVTGDVYIAYEHNWASNLTSRNPCASEPVQERLVQVPFEQCLSSISGRSPCGPGSPSGPALATAINIVSMDGAFIPGYSRFPMNDFPRIATSDPYGTVSIVWNDARFRPGGDILLESFRLGTGFPQAVQKGHFPNANDTPTRLTNNSTKPGDFNFLPGLRYSEPDGRLDVTWYDRRSQVQPSDTDVYGAFEVDPSTTTTPGNRRVTNVTSNWLNTSSDITPNFGDYTDNYVKQSGTAAAGYLAPEDFVAWADGRTTAPNPFEAYITGI